MHRSKILIRKRDYSRAFNFFKTIKFNEDFIATHIAILKSCREGWVITSRLPMQTFDI